MYCTEHLSLNALAVYTNTFPRLKFMRPPILKLRNLVAAIVPYLLSLWIQQ